MTRKLLTIIVILLVVLVGGVFAYKTWQGRKSMEKSESQLTADETANWKVYRNEEYRFELRYPPNWIVEENSGEEIGVLSEYLDTLDRKKDNFFFVSFYDSKEKWRGKDSYIDLQIIDPSPVKNIEETKCHPIGGRETCITTYKSIAGSGATINTFEWNEEVDQGIGREIQFINDGKLIRFFASPQQFNEMDLSKALSQTLYVDRISDTFRFTR